MGSYRPKQIYKMNKGVIKGIPHNVGNNGISNRVIRKELNRVMTKYGLNTYTQQNKFMKPITEMLYNVEYSKEKTKYYVCYMLGALAAIGFDVLILYIIYWIFISFILV